MNDDLATLKTRFTPEAAEVLKLDRQISSARFTACGRYLLAASHDALVRRFDFSGEEKKELNPLAGHGGWVQRIALPHVPDSDVVYSCDSWGQIRCASFVDHEAGPRWAVTAAHDGWILDLALSPSGKHLVSCGIDRAIRVWSTTDGAKVHEFTNPGCEVLSIAFSRDESSVLSGDLSGRVRQWDLASGTVAREFDATRLAKSDRLQDVGGVRRIEFCPDGSCFVCAGTIPKGGGNVQGIPAVFVFDWQSGTLRKTIELGKEGDVYVTDVSFHPAGFLITTISGNPGTGKLVFCRLEDDAPFFETTKMPNCHSATLHPGLRQLAVVATNGNSNGNGRNLDKDGKYPGNFSPIHVWKLPATSQ